MTGAGLGAAIPAALGILGSSFAPVRPSLLFLPFFMTELIMGRRQGPRKTTAFALFSAGAPMGGSLGAVIGGVFVSSFSALPPPSDADLPPFSVTEYAPKGWRAVFYVLAGISALVGLSAFFVVPPDHEKDRTLTVDWVGGALVTSAVTLLTFALADGEGAPDGVRYFLFSYLSLILSLPIFALSSIFPFPLLNFLSRSSILVLTLPFRQWRTPYIPALLAVSILLFLLFWFYERHLERNTTSAPLMRTEIWFKGRFAIVQLIGALGWSSFASYSASSFSSFFAVGERTR
jgi:hypothetical protein